MTDFKARPTCTSPIQFVKWSEKQKIPPNDIDWVCQDCSPEFKKQMMEAGKCDWPCVKFFMMSDGTMEGRRMSIHTPRGYPGVVPVSEITEWPPKQPNDPAS